MKWVKKKTDDNEGKSIPFWQSDCKSYSIIQNINGGNPPKKWRGNVDKNGHRWLFEVLKVINNKEKVLGVMPSLKDAKLLVADDCE